MENKLINALKTEKGGQSDALNAFDCPASLLSGASKIYTSLFRYMLLFFSTVINTPSAEKRGQHYG